ncbi:peptide chain release factor N(5)-glutamine methyltransferase [Streptococcus sp. sy010]|uniref:peptide chain release factor N(5)-glutamine methyltransferase n=1 Tax=Streptococcus sp. sy010 TaxID=2600148 RepID=UPI0011B6EBDF|nr:peptide chain release factor N(5)-glutamine methyltransferase [Streptococcus sp. sy010]TWT16708.1 peptide chain release factor N(5)-glutamine methyltransferase [Streptococcus sp. sy010]
MNYASLLNHYGDQLELVGEEREALNFVFREMKAWSYTEFVLKLSQEVEVEDASIIKEIFEQLYRHYPAQYILGKSQFYGLDLMVDERVLIPRPETEELVDLILAENSAAILDVLDVGTGSGAIALSLAKTRPKWQITASDLAQEALDLAQTNAQKNNLELTFVRSDLLTNIEGKFDIIVSNPPYIAYEDKEEVGLNVLTSEPHLALFADEKGLALYRRLAEISASYLKPKGKIYLEIGYKQGQAVKDLFTKYFPNHRIRVLTDQFGQDRMVVIDHEFITRTTGD